MRNLSQESNSEKKITIDKAAELLNWLTDCGTEYTLVGGWLQQPKIVQKLTKF
jgi:hypothetical protein